mmetsp:Transcript_16069/g.56155  ORF Transcript_16069/g.56155 Transcript_16069/m.56155 type:complete len:219 (-) Transcript_16069:706-1362(-)
MRSRASSSSGATPLRSTMSPMSEDVETRRARPWRRGAASWQLPLAQSTTTSSPSWLRASACAKRAPTAWWSVALPEKTNFSARRGSSTTEASSRLSSKSSRAEASRGSVTTSPSSLASTTSSERRASSEARMAAFAASLVSREISAGESSPTPPRSTSFMPAVPKSSSKAASSAHRAARSFAEYSRKPRETVTHSCAASPSTLESKMATPSWGTRAGM